MKTSIALMALLVPAAGLGQQAGIAVVGLLHGHAWQHLPKMVKGEPARLVGVSEPNQELIAEAKRMGVADNLVFPDWRKMLDAARPQIVWAFVENNRHLEIVQACAPRKIHVMLEKPLAAAFADAVEIRRLARQHGIQVLTNYQMAWWPSNYSARKYVDDGLAGPLWRMHAVIGNPGPRNADVRNRYFVEWLTDPDRNGGGALIDFGCYGAIWSLWFMGRPETVMAQVDRLQPARTPKVEDNAVILLHYRRGLAILEGSWSFFTAYQHMEIFGDKAGLRVSREGVELHKNRNKGQPLTVDPLPPERSEPIAHMVHAVRTGKPVEGLAALDLNVGAVEILDAARKSVRTGQPVRLPQ